MCLFCRIVSGEIPSAKEYEDDKILAFREDRAKKDAGRPGGFHHNLSAIPG